MNNKKIIIFTDGGARGNPGPAGCGAVIKSDQGEILFELSKYLGHATNNQAEYSALLMALEKAKTIGAEEVECYLDSELVVKQLNHEYKVRDKELAKLFVKIHNLNLGFKKIKFHHILREKNKLADQLANEAMDRAK